MKERSGRLGAFLWRLAEAGGGFGFVCLILVKLPRHVPLMRNQTSVE